MLETVCKKVSQCDVFEKFLSQRKPFILAGFQTFCDVCDVFTVLFLLLREKEEKVNKYYILIENASKNVKNVTEGIFWVYLEQIWYWRNFVKVSCYES